MHTILAYLRYPLTYMRQVAIHMMDYLYAATTSVLSPGMFHIEDLRSMLRHIESELPSTIHLPISSDDTLHFYWYLNTHVLIVEGQFLLHICVPMQNRGQLQICEVFDQPVSSLSTQYKINHRYIGVTYDVMEAVTTTDQQYIACYHGHREFCRINAPYQPSIMYNTPVCKNDQAVGEQWSLSVYPTWHIDLYLLQLLQTSGSFPQTLRH